MLKVSVQGRTMQDMMTNPMADCRTPGNAHVVSSVKVARPVTRCAQARYPAMLHIYLPCGKQASGGLTLCEVAIPAGGEVWPEQPCVGKPQPWQKSASAVEQCEYQHRNQSASRCGSTGARQHLKRERKPRAKAGRHRDLYRVQRRRASPAGK